MRIVLACLVVMLAACADESGPATVSQTSVGIPQLSDRISFVESYVNFKREYMELEYDIVYQNNGTGGGIPGPSDWDIRLIAKVPAEQIEQWLLPKPLDAATPEPMWHKETAHEIDISSVNEWYVDGNRTVGLDRANSIVVYRNSTL